MTELEQLTRRVQKWAGLTGLDLDGRWGVQTARATCATAGIDMRVSSAPSAEVLASPDGAADPPPGIDARSQRCIASLSPWVRPVATAFLQKLQASGIRAQIISGTRSYDEQDALYAKGRTADGSIVTNARGGYSNHNFGVAFDIGIFTAAGAYLEESLLYDKAGSLGKAMGLSWGGDWESIQDKPHFELKPQWAQHLSEAAMIAELRRRTAAGESIA